MRKTKEEIHGSIYDKGSITVGSATREEHLNAMQEYADQEMEAFAEWVVGNYEAPWVSPRKIGLCKCYLAF